jgi:hypothetical protein
MNIKKIFKNAGKLFQRVEVIGVISLIFSILSISGVTQVLNIQFKDAWDIGRFIFALLVIAIVVFISFQLVGNLFTWIGEYGEKMDFERDPKDDYYNKSNNHKRVGIWVVNGTTYDLTDCWAELKVVDKHSTDKHNRVLLWKDETSEKTTIAAGDRKFLNIAEEDDMFVSFLLSKGNATCQSYPSDKGTYYSLNLKIIVALKGRIDNIAISPREFYAEISYQTVPPPMVVSYLANTPVYPSFGSVLRLEKIKPWKRIQSN